MRNQNMSIERQEEIEKREEMRREEEDVSWYKLSRKMKVEFINVIVTRNGRLDANGKSVKDASHDDLIQEAKKLNYALDQEDQKIWNEHLSTTYKPRKNKRKHIIQKNQ